MKTIQFQTGRSYSAQGQRIVARYEHGSIVFKDLDRNISGKIVYNNSDDSIHELRVVIMFAYDRGMYDWVANPDDLAWVD